MFGPDDSADELQWPEIQADLLPVARAAADTYVTFYEALLSDTWPGPVAENVETVAREISVHAEFFARLSESQSFTLFITQLNDLPNQYNSAKVLKAKLGLDANIGDDDLCGQQPTTNEGS